MFKTILTLIVIHKTIKRTMRKKDGDVKINININIEND